MLPTIVIARSAVMSFAFLLYQYMSTHPAKFRNWWLSIDYIDRSVQAFPPLKRLLQLRNTQHFATGKLGIQEPSLITSRMNSLNLIDNINKYVFDIRVSKYFIGNSDLVSYNFTFCLRTNSFNIQRRA